MKYTLTDDSERKSYFFTHNSFGDIIGIYSGSGVLTAQYEYDAWGKVISITDGNGNEITDTNNIGLLNPFRYRGYYYDSETGLYYLMSRYYDPVTRRFLNADGYFQSGGSILDANMSAYCRNNPITFIDPTGTKCSTHDPYYVPNCFACSPTWREFVKDRYSWIKSIDPTYTLQLSSEDTFFDFGGISVTSYNQYSYEIELSSHTSSANLSIPDLSVSLHNKLCGYDFSFNGNGEFICGTLGKMYGDFTNSIGFGVSDDSECCCWDVSVDYHDGWYYSAGYRISITNDTKNSIRTAGAIIGAAAIGYAIGGPYVSYIFGNLAAYFTNGQFSYAPI